MIRYTTENQVACRWCERKVGREAQRAWAGELGGK